MDLTRKLDRYQYISFDIFDTLIRRSVARPRDLFLLMEGYCRHEQMDIPAGFAQKRRQAEIRANEKNGGHASLREIYDELAGEFGKDTAALMELEVRLELDGCRADPDGAAWLARCVAKGKTVILISDMYLPGEVVEKMLQKCGIEGYQKLYISCECGARKSDGTLFRLVLDKLKIRPAQLLHIGDNRRGDLLMPLSLGIRTIWKRNEEKKLCRPARGMSEESALAFRTLRACIRNSSEAMSSYEKMGCRLFGPVLYGFTQWLAEQLEREDIHDVYFMSRDGYMLKRAFDALKLDGVHTRYLYCSRRAYQVPLLWRHSAFEDVIKPFAQAERMTLRSFLMRIGLEPALYDARAKARGLDLDRVYEKGAFYSSKEIVDFYQTAIRQDAEENSKKEYETLCAYLRSMHFPKKIAVVDIGYRGSMQRALTELIAEEGWDIEVMGYYVGVSSDAQLVRSGAIRAKGYLFDLDTGEGYERSIKKGMSIFELQFLAPHGSVMRFTRQNGEIVPMLDRFEYEGGTGQRVNEMEVVGGYQAGALGFIDYMVSALPLDAVRISPEAAIYAFVRMLTGPTLKQARLWGDFRFINYERSYIAAPRSLAYYLTHVKQFRKEFLACNWKIGFMRRLFRVPLPYEKIYGALRKLYKKI